MSKMEIRNLKEKNASKTLILLFFGCIMSFGISQNSLEGLYYVDDNPPYVVDGGSSTHYEFFKNGTFERITTGEFGTQYYGSGTYNLDNNKRLILNYNKTEPIQMGYHISKMWTNNSDEVDINFKLFDLDENAVKYANIIYKDSVSKHGYNGIVADDEGIAKLKFKKESKRLQFEITCLNFKYYSLVIDKNYNYNISVYLQNEYNGLPIMNQMNTIQLEKIRPKYFTVRNKNGSVTTWRKLED